VRVRTSVGRRSPSSGQSQALEDVTLTVTMVLIFALFPKAFLL
jgi:hypothetical protein